MRFQFTKGLHELGNGCFAWLQPDGGWGWSNAGLVTDAGASLLVDTLFDLALTREMLAAMRRATPAAARIGTLVNTHANGDHCYGNVAGARRRDHRLEGDRRGDGGGPAGRDAAPDRERRAARPGGGLLPPRLRGLRFPGHRAGAPDADLRARAHAAGRRQAREAARGGSRAHPRRRARPFSRKTASSSPATSCSSRAPRSSGRGPSRTGSAPASGSRRWTSMSSCPATGRSPTAAARGACASTWPSCSDAARERFDAGLSARDAAHDIELGAYADWRDAERIAVNVETVYRELRGGGEPRQPARALRPDGRARAALARRGPGCTPASSRSRRYRKSARASSAR